MSQESKRIRLLRSRVCKNELYHPKTADAEYDSITCAARHQSWMNVPSCHIECRPEITIVQPNAQHPFPDETFYGLFIRTLRNQLPPFYAPFSRSIISCVLYLLCHCPFV